MGDKESTYKEEEAKLFQKMQQLEDDFAEKTRLLEEEYSKKAKSHNAFKTSLDTRESELTNQVKKLENTVKELKEEISVLKQNEKENKDTTPTKTQSTGVFQGLEYQLTMLQQLETNLGEKLKKLEDANAKVSKENLDLRVKIEGLDAEKEELLRMIKDYEKDEALNSRKLKDDSYEAALREQFNSMKVAFEDKIKSLNDNIQQIKREKGKELIDIKNELSREKDGRELLLRKLQLYTKS